VRPVLTLSDHVSWVERSPLFDEAVHLVEPDTEELDADDAWSVS
jgi:hypothetical protein